MKFWEQAQAERLRDYFVGTFGVLMSKVEHMKANLLTERDMYPAGP